MWDFFETVRHRHSVHRYQADMPVEPHKLAAILEMACAAPTAGGVQAYRIHCVESGDKRAALEAAVNDASGFGGAPVILVFSADHQRAEALFGERGRNLFAMQDATIAAAYAQLATTASGLGSHWIGDFDEAKVCALLPEQTGAFTPLAMIALGYPAENPPATPRRPISDVVVRL
ncbi:MAG: nitroreductase family protein [Halothiobacillaceae bacterium]